MQKYYKQCFVLLKRIYSPIIPAWFFNFLKIYSFYAVHIGYIHCHDIKQFYNVFVVWPYEIYVSV